MGTVCSSEWWTVRFRSSYLLSCSPGGPREKVAQLILVATYPTSSPASCARREASARRGSNYIDWLPRLMITPLTSISRVSATMPLSHDSIIEPDIADAA